ncbi:hypothetical protein [Microbacterium sp. 179-I 3D3 NHS]|uniref:hypothetical protein n=1 Tax=unclassified Microbacterium TaxID=2609290 RepID=UPI0039A03D9A
MGREENKNDELREEHREQDEHRQELRDAAEAGEGTVADLGSQDERRKEGEGRL